MVKSVPTWLRALKNLDVSAARTVDGWKLMYMYKSHVLLYLALYIGCSSKQTKKKQWPGYEASVLCITHI